MQTPPGSHSVSSRAATFTPSPKMSLPSIMMSPTLIPTRSTIRRSAWTPADRRQLLVVRQSRASPASRHDGETLHHDVKLVVPRLFVLRDLSASFGMHPWEGQVKAR